MFVASALWLLAWGFVGVSIVLATTSGPPASVLDLLLQGVGEFYLQSVETLRVFAAATTLPRRWVDVGYAVLAAVPLSVHFFIFAVAAVPRESDAGLDFLFNFAVGTVVVGVLGAGLLYLGAQLLVLSAVGVGVSLVPLAYFLRSA
ncbi:hypothetical protein [Halobellus limi]|jgi:hypothetical protein|uniref:Uncharacterized protein n=1 Tax=Halobellus limi TaxID=699433 RepID=A0A1H5WLV8_9EURY|nr:hypothetical protein [Halobellus limi]QCC46418.1 hypothetical protein DV707_01280 [Halobellus limi]SEF99947.1 hypothetical protein SAMN04488133_1305 [Halobellus limi]